MVTVVPTMPKLGLRLIMFGAPGTTNATELLEVPPTVTTTGPVTAPTGTRAVMLVEDQAETLAATPLNVIVLVPCVGPKSAPRMVLEFRSDLDLVQSKNCRNTRDGEAHGIAGYAAHIHDHIPRCRTLRNRS